MTTQSTSMNPNQDELRQQIKSQLEATRQAFHQLLDEIDVEDLKKPSLNPAWTIAEMLYHMSLAPRILPSDVNLIRRLKWVPKLPTGPFNRLNVYFTRRGARNATKESLAEAYDLAHLRTLQSLDSVKDEEWGIGAEYPDWDPLLSGYVTVERLFRYLTLHFESHTRDIRQALDLEQDGSTERESGG
jgi:hypothetical protein